MWINRPKKITRNRSLFFLVLYFVFFSFVSLSLFLIETGKKGISCYKGDLLTKGGASKDTPRNAKDNLKVPFLHPTKDKFRGVPSSNVWNLSTASQTQSIEKMKRDQDPENVFIRETYGRPSPTNNLISWNVIKMSECLTRKNRPLANEREDEY